MNKTVVQLTVVIVLMFLFVGAFFFVCATYQNDYFRKNAERQKELGITDASPEVQSALDQALLDSLDGGSALVKTTALGGLFSERPKERFMIVVGAFRERHYAERRVETLNRKGYPASILSFKNGLLAVVVCPSDELEETLKKLSELKDSGVCPADAWILTTQ